MYAQIFLHHFVRSVHFPTVQKHISIETIPHFSWKNDRGIESANGIRPAFSGGFVSCLLKQGKIIRVTCASIHVFSLPIRDKCCSAANKKILLG